MSTYSKGVIAPTFIYVAIQQSVPGWVKIGMSYSPKKRISDFRVGSALKDYELVYEAPIITREFARRIEIFFKNNYESRRGEWYRLDVDDAIKAIERYKLTYTSTANSKITGSIRLNDKMILTKDLRVIPNKLKK